MVLPAPGSSARRNRSGVRGRSSPYTAVIWWGRACRSGRDGQHRIEQGRVADAEGLCGQPPCGWVTVEGRSRALCGDGERPLLLPTEDSLVGPPVLVAVGDCHEVRAVPLDLDHRDRSRSGDAEGLRPGDEVLQPGADGAFERGVRLRFLHASPRPFAPD